VEKFGVRFQLFEKISVNGSAAHPLFAFLKKRLTGFITNDVKWNFTKFLLDRHGTPIKRYAPNEEPFSMEPKLVELLDEPE